MRNRVTILISANSSGSKETVTLQDDKDFNRRINKAEGPFGRWYGSSSERYSDDQDSSKPLPSKSVALAGLAIISPVIQHSTRVTSQIPSHQHPTPVAHGLMMCGTRMQIKLRQLLIIAKPPTGLDWSFGSKEINCLRLL